MITVLSPAKNQRIDGGVHPVQSSPVFLDRAAALGKAMAAYSPWQLETLLKINPRLALNAWEMYQAFDPEQPGVAALGAYYGLQYQNLDGDSLTREEFAFAQDHVRILSGFYGVLRPGDGIQPYRLEMQTPLALDGKRNLYDWWGDVLCRELFASGEPVINLSSGEYSRAVNRHLAPRDRWITCDFLVRHKGKLQMLPTAAKTARGQMARFIITHRLDRPEDLWAFTWGDYGFVPGLSTGEKYVFVQGWEE